jgi:SAM-dependent methyltransferase
VNYAWRETGEQFIDSDFARQRTMRVDAKPLLARSFHSGMVMIEDAYVGKWVHPESDAPLEMVGRKGDHDLDWIAAYVIDILKITGADEVLDLCCGNGLVTARVAAAAREVTGIDYSRLLLRQARDISKTSNVSYIEGDARSLSSVLEGRRFSKIYISAAFQYFDQQTGRDVLVGLHRVAQPDARVGIIDVPDRARKTAHILRAVGRLLLPERGSHAKRFPTMRSRVGYFARNTAAAFGKSSGAPEIGYWWSRAGFQQLALECGFACTILDQPRENPQHTYRFDALLRPA